MKILVTGGNGLVGKHLQDILPDATYISSKDYDLTESFNVHRLMYKERPDIVIHLAARVGGILDNITHPVDYLEQNILINTNVLRYSHQFNVSNVIFSNCSMSVVYSVINSYWVLDILSNSTL